MVYTYQPPLMDIDKETIPELQPIFAFLNSHTNKLYQEGYFLKLDDQDISRPLRRLARPRDLLMWY
jgi:CCR4-NOT transcriptional complex subunit CAF120